ncbi:CheB methylesterase domain-containing protein [Paracoccus nototheniae]|uniref:CheB methylesterase domain-containing protein n=1 Tax=Paracoccus nototheniae TaxID=2489002 RepID=UPI001039D909|nr:CheB methylesterase domain-containing protein [Paracoccus nototheniae]
MSKPVLLIADPDIMRRNAAFRRCADHGVRIHSAADLADARRLAHSHLPDRVAIASELAVQSGFPALADLLARTGARVVIYGPPQPGLTLARVADLDQMVATLLCDMVPNRPGAPNPVAKSSHEQPPDLILIGASTGGITALEAVLRDFTSDCPPTLVVQHIRPGFAEGLIRRLDKLLMASVRAAGDDTRLQRGVIVIAADSERHLGLALRGGMRTRLQEGPAMSGHRPSVDMLFDSGARLAARLDLRAALLTGMGSDGALGMCALRRAGALTIAQDRDSSVVWGMPRMAIEMGGAAEVMPLARIGQALLRPLPAARMRFPA